MLVAIRRAHLHIEIQFKEIPILRLQLLKLLYLSIFHRFVVQVC